ncbi:hypothetical protein ACOMHN_001859 [Nucella lapillus]
MHTVYCHSMYSLLWEPTSPEDLAAVRRAEKEKKGSRPILVKFVSRRKRREVMERKKVLREKEEHRGTYLNDDLTPLRARLLGMSAESRRIRGPLQ